MGRQLEIWNVKWTLFLNFHQCIFKVSWIHLVTNCRWVWMEVPHLFQNQLYNHMVSVMARCQHSSFKTHHCIFYMKGDSILMWLNIWFGKTWIENASPLFIACMKTFAPMNNNLEHLDFHIPPKVFLCLKFWMHPFHIFLWMHDFCQTCCC